MDDPLLKADPWDRGRNLESAEQDERTTLSRQKPVDGINIKSCLITHNQARNRKESKAQCAPSEYGRRNPASLGASDVSFNPRASSTNSDGFVVLSSQGSTCADSARTSSQDSHQTSYKDWGRNGYNNWEHVQGKGYGYVDWGKNDWGKKTVPADYATHYEEEVVPLTELQVREYRPFHNIGYLTNFAGCSIAAARADAAAAVAYCNFCHCSFPRRDATQCFYDKECKYLIDRSAGKAMINRINAHLRPEGNGLNLADPDAEVWETCYQCQGIRAYNNKYYYTEPHGKTAEGEPLYRLRRGWIHGASVSKKGGNNLDSNDRFKLKDHLE